MFNEDFDEDDEIFKEWIESNDATKVDFKADAVPTQIPVNISDIAGPSAPVSFSEAFNFLKRDMEKEFKDNLPSATQVKTLALGSGKKITVNPCQRGNPVLEHIRNVPWEYADEKSKMLPDYIMGISTCCLFLSLRYHALRPNYIYDRVQALRRSRAFSLRILLGLVDVKEPTHAVKELAKAALVAEMTLILAFSNEEAGTYLETFKSYQNKPADLIRVRVQKGFTTRSIETLSTIKSVNSTDAHTLLSTFDDIGNIAKASERDLALCPGIGGLKAKRIYEMFQQPFLKEQKAEES